MTLDRQVIAVLDGICDQGCEYVDSCIEVLAAGAIPEQTRDLSERQRQSLLEELRSIMAVYHARSDDTPGC